MQKDSSEKDASSVVVKPMAELTNKQGILLVPRPSSNPNDPLNWSTTKKAKVLALLCLSAYCGNVAALSGQLAYPVQAKGYGVTVLESSYSVSAAISGLAAGALFFVPLGNVVGRWSITFWSLLGCMACAVWSAKMTEESDYVKFIISRLLSGLFGSVPSAVGGGMILDIFYLHNRGTAFVCYEVAILFGATSGPTFSGFIAGTTSWTWCFWYTVPLLIIVAALVFFFAEETGFDREREVETHRLPEGYWAQRVALFLPGTKAVSNPSVGGVARSFAAPFQIGFSPVTVLCGLFTLVAFGWILLNDILSPLFLQNPLAEGGYDFTPVQNAAFTFCVWVAIIIAQGLGSLINDRLPLWICRRYYNGVWQPELRLYVCLVSVVFTPVGMGISGAALKNHYHYIVYALGYFIVAASVLIIVPVATNYVAESFAHRGTECTLVMTFYRLSWGVAIPFFASQWIDEVGINWVYGIAAFISVGSWALIQVLLWRGPQLRKFSLLKDVGSGEGQQLFVKEM